MQRIYAMWQAPVHLGTIPLQNTVLKNEKEILFSRFVESVTAKLLFFEGTHKNHE